MTPETPAPYTCNGLARTSLSLPPTPGPVRIEANYGSAAPTFFSATAEPGAASYTPRAAIAPDTSALLVGVEASFRVYVYDEYGRAQVRPKFDGGLVSLAAVAVLVRRGDRG